MQFRWEPTKLLGKFDGFWTILLVKIQKSSVRPIYSVFIIAYDFGRH
jgi:hypothetical protein